MRYRIHFTWPDGTNDSFVIEGDDLGELSKEAQQGVADRNGSDPWSEELDD